MRSRIISLFAILEVCTLIEPSFSSTFLKFGEKSNIEEYKRLKSASRYRGVLFSLSPAQKRGMCEDVFSAQLYINSDTKIESSEEKIAKMVISDSLETVQNGVEAEYPIFLRRTVEIPWLEPEWNISFRCLGKNFRERSPTAKLTNWYHLYSAFYPKWLYSARRIVSMNESFSLSNFITLSPDYVEQQQAELEKHYVNTRVNLRALKEESPEYVDQIELRVDLLNLTKLQRFILCASILSTPVYRKEGWEFSYDWMDATSDTLEYVTKDLSLTSTLYPKDRLIANCIPCQAFKDGTDLTSETETLYITLTYDNQYSVVVLKKEDEDFYVDKCFRNIAILITLFEKMDYDVLFSNFPRPKLTNESKQN